MHNMGGPHPATHLTWFLLCPPYQGEKKRTNAPFLFFQFRLTEPSLAELLFKDYTYTVSKGEGKQK